jgi:uncharacterized protein
MEVREVRTAKTHVKLHGKTLLGLAAPYSTPAEVQGGAFIEVIAEGAFRSVLSKPDLDVTANVNHNDAMILGRTTNGTLRLSETHRGLEFAVDLPDSDYARHIHENVSRGDLSGCSFAFNLGPGDDDWEERSGRLHRRIKSFSQLYDVSVVSRPTYSGTSVDARSLTAIGTVAQAKINSFVQQQAKAEHRAILGQCEFVQAQLGVPLLFDFQKRERCLEDRQKLIRLANDLVQMRSQGWTVSVVHDQNSWPSVVFIGRTDEERAIAAIAAKRSRRTIDFILNL